MSGLASGCAPIFVMGTPRSGTTLTARILGNHSRIFMPAETHFFDDIYSRRRQLGDPGDPAAMRRIVERLSTLYRRQHEGRYQSQLRHLFDDPENVARLVGPCRDYRDVLTRFIAMQMTDAKKGPRWGNQVPRDVFNAPDILSLYPDAKFVVCVRDVRDFLLSYREMRTAVPPKHVSRHRRIYHPVVTSYLWKATVRQIPAIRRQVPQGNLSIVRYEDLVTSPRSVVEEICRVVGEAFEPQMLDVRAHNSSDPSQRGEASGIFDRSVGRWRGVLPPEDACVAQMVAEKEMRALGYEPAPTGARPIRVAPLFLSLPFALARGIYANRAKQGAPLRYVARRVASLVRSSDLEQGGRAS